MFPLKTAKIKFKLLQSILRYIPFHLTSQWYWNTSIYKQVRAILSNNIQIWLLIYTKDKCKTYYYWFLKRFLQYQIYRKKKIYTTYLQKIYDIVNILIFCHFIPSPSQICDMFNVMFVKEKYCRKYGQKPSIYQQKNFQQKPNLLSLWLTNKLLLRI